MHFPLTNRLLGMLLVGALISPVLSAQATVSNNSTIITLEKSAYFVDIGRSVPITDPAVTHPPA